MHTLFLFCTFQHYCIQFLSYRAAVYHYRPHIIPSSAFFSSPSEGGMEGRDGLPVSAHQTNLCQVNVTSNLARAAKFYFGQYRPFYTTLKKINKRPSDGGCSVACEAPQGFGIGTLGIFSPELEAAHAPSTVCVCKKRRRRSS